MKTRIVGICGGSGSGKTTVVRKIGETFPDFVCIPQDNYYKSAYNIRAPLKTWYFCHSQGGKIL
ncbi:hypothetical protein [Marispirochaeta sp.]|uniref:hypothetical protein n=1 Tax=Marispirochaeta sp. TaxID=2038653 RepID=UPI0037493237